MVPSSHQSPKIVPDFRYVRVQADRSGIRIEGIPVLIDLVIQHANGAPKRRVATISINRLLVGFIRLGILLLGHVASSKKIPTLRIRVIWND